MNPRLPDLSVRRNLRRGTSFAGTGGSGHEVGGYQLCWPRAPCRDGRCWWVGGTGRDSARLCVALTAKGLFGYVNFEAQPSKIE